MATLSTSMPEQGMKQSCAAGALQLRETPRAAQRLLDARHTECHWRRTCGPEKIHESSLALIRRNVLPLVKIMQS